MKTEEVKAYAAIDGSLWRSKEEAEKRNEDVVYKNIIHEFEKTIESSWRGEGFICHKELYLGFLKAILSNNAANRKHIQKLYSKIDNELEY